MSARHGQHVIPADDGWAVRRAGAARASKVYSTKAEAIAEARRLARRHNGELYIHDSAGKIIERNSYGSDPFPPKG